jgi:hypothetical protein
VGLSTTPDVTHSSDVPSELFLRALAHWRQRLSCTYGVHESTTTSQPEKRRPGQMALKEVSCKIQTKFKVFDQLVVAVKFKFVLLVLNVKVCLYGLHGATSPHPTGSGFTFSFQAVP